MCELLTQHQRTSIQAIKLQGIRKTETKDTKATALCILNVIDYLSKKTICRAHVSQFFPTWLVFLLLWLLYCFINYSNFRIAKFSYSILENTSGFLNFRPSWNSKFLHFCSSEHPFDSQLPGVLLKMMLYLWCSILSHTKNWSAKTSLFRSLITPHSEKLGRFRNFTVIGK